MHLDKKLEKVEKYGLPRTEFPMDYNDHNIHILDNKANQNKNNRIIFKFSLFCATHSNTATVRGSFWPDDEWKSRISYLKFSALAELLETC